MMEMKHISVRSDTHTRIKALSEETGMKMYAIIERFVENGESLIKQ
jgi:hypothetical protein